MANIKFCRIKGLAVLAAAALARLAVKAAELAEPSHPAMLLGKARAPARMARAEAEAATTEEMLLIAITEAAVAEAAQATSIQAKSPGVQPRPDKTQAMALQQSL